MTHPQWAWDVGLNGRPHDLGNISTYLGKPTGLEDYIGWLANNFDPSISWKDLEVDPRILGRSDGDQRDPRSAGCARRRTLRRRRDRGLQPRRSPARRRSLLSPCGAGHRRCGKGDITILADSGIRNGLDVVRMIALGADSVLLGRAYLYALATHGKQGVANLLNLIEKEMKVAMTLTGTKTIGEISRDSLVQNADALHTFNAMTQGNAA